MLGAVDCYARRRSPELIDDNPDEPNGPNGLLFPIGDVEGMAGAAIELLRDEQRLAAMSSRRGGQHRTGFARAGLFRCTRSTTSGCWRGPRITSGV